MKYFGLFLGSLLCVTGCRQSKQHIEPSSLLAYNDAAQAARLGKNLGVQSTTSVGQDIQLETIEGRIVRVRPSTVVYVKELTGKVHEFFPPIEVHLDGETISITRESEEPTIFQRKEIADVYILL